MPNLVSILMANEEVPPIDSQDIRHSWFSKSRPKLIGAQSEVWHRTRSLSVHREAPSNPSTDLFKEIEVKFKKFSPEVRRVLQLCVSSVAVVFTEVDLAATKKNMKNPENADGTIAYSRLPRIPSGAMRALWEELLSDDEKAGNEERAHDHDIQFWNDFLTEKERNLFYKKALSGRKHESTFDFICDNLTKIGILRKVEVEHRSSRNLCDSQTEEFFEIPLDLQYQYGVFLARTPKEEGGFSLKSYSKTIRCLSKIMITACIRRMEKMFPCVSMSIEKDKDGKYGLICIDEKSDIADMSFWRGNGLIEQSTDYATSYAVSYALERIPSLMMRARKMDNAVMLLGSSNFAFIRVVMLGIPKAVYRLKRDCEELNLRTKWMEHFNADYSIISAFKVTRKHLISQAITEIFSKRENCETDVGDALHELARSSERLGFEDVALDYYEGAFQYKIEHCVPNSSIIRTQQHLSEMYLRKHMYSDGLLVLSKLLDIQSIEVKDDKLKLAETMKKMAVVNCAIKNYDEAISLYEDVLLIERSKLDSAGVLETNISLGRIFNIIKNYEKALACFEESMRLGLIIYGEKHDLIAKCYHLQGVTHVLKKSYSDALDCFGKSLNLWKLNSSDQHELVKTLHTMATTHTHLSDWNKANLCFEEVFDIKLTNDSKESEKDARIYYDWGIVLRNLNKHEEAFEKLQHALKIIMEYYGEEHQELVDVCFQMGFVFRDKGEMATALEYYKEALNLERKHSGEEHQKVAEIFHEMGYALCMSNSYEQGIECLQKAYDIRRKLLGNGHIDLAATCQLIGVAFCKNSESIKALKFFDEALCIRKKELGEADEKVADTLYGMGFVQKQRHEYDLSLDYFLQALKIRESILGNAHIKVADTMYNVASVYTMKEEIKEALFYFHAAFDIYKEVIQKDNIELIHNVLQWIEFLKGKKSAKMPFFKDILVTG